MEKPVRFCYSIADIALLWGWDVNDVLHEIGARKLQPVFKLTKVRCRVLIGSDKKGWREEEEHITVTGGYIPRSFNGLYSLTPFSALMFWGSHHPIQNNWEGDLLGQAFDSRGRQLIPEQSVKVTIADLWITNEERVRFEGGLQTEPTPAAGTDKLVTDVELCERLRSERKTEKQIAQELKASFPRINPSRIGRLITAVPGMVVTTEAYRKRGKRLLE